MKITKIFGGAASWDYWFNIVKTDIYEMVMFKKFSKRRAVRIFGAYLLFIAAVLVLSGISSERHAMSLAEAVEQQLKD